MFSRDGLLIDHALIARALEEDIGFGDVTTLSTVPAERTLTRRSSAARAA